MADEGREEGQAPKRPATERADEILSRAGWTAGLFARMAGMRLARIAAYAREEAEDMWAEAQSMRRSDRAGADDVSAPSDEDLKVTTSQGIDVSDRAEQRTAEPRGEGPEKGPEPEQRPMAGDYVGAAGGAEADPEEKPVSVSEAEAASPAESSEEAAEDRKKENIKATDAARRRAEELGVDLAQVEGTGAHGQITVEDVRKNAEAGSSS